MIENLSKRFMKKSLRETGKKPADEPIVIADECGDSMWDAVLGQQEKACGVKVVSKNATSLLKSMDVAEMSDPSEAK
jgi:hypothetical protein